MKRICFFVCCLLLTAILTGCSCDHIFSDWEDGSGDKQYRICSKCQETEWRTVIRETISNETEDNVSVEDDDKRIAENKMIGNWSAEVLLIDGEVYTDKATCSLCYAKFYDDYSGKIVAGDDSYALDWEYYKTDDDMIYYRMFMGDEYRNIGIVTEKGHEFYGLLVVYLNDETAIILDKD